ncbi:MAG: hypothetical protein JWR21_973 [Herminiimonas sp.]|nr:hypothetical protein [Herminiimonas sp.]MDB5852373.1 hypothetical protein [Herminiimonas sp.]
MSLKKSVRFTQRFSLPLLIVTIATLLAACGGGTEAASDLHSQAGAAASTSPQSQSVASEPVIAVTQTNLSGKQAGDIAANALAISDYLFDPAEYADQFIPGAERTRFPMAASSMARYFLAIGGNAGLANGWILAPQELTCLHGGSATYLLGPSSPARPNFWDTVTMVARNCTTIDDITFNGELSSRMAGPGVLLPGQASADTSFLRFKRFSIGTTKGAVELDGDLDYVLRVGTSGSISFTASGTAMNVVGQRNGQAPIDVTIRQYKTSTSFAPGDIRSAIEFTRQFVGSSGQASTVIVKTPQTFVRTAGQYASSGVLSVSDGVSSTTVTVLNGTSVRVDYSPAADGIVTESNTLSWSEFLSRR